MDGEAPSGTAREEAVGSPPIREGTMSTTLIDFPARLLDLPRQPLGPPQVSDPLSDTRRISVLTRNRGRAHFHQNYRRIGTVGSGD